MKRNEFGDVDVTDAIAIGKTKSVFSFDVVCDTPDTSTSHGFFARVHQGYSPGFGLTLMHLHAVLAHVESNVRHVKKVVGKVLLDDVPLVAAANHEVVDAVVRIGLHDVPEDRLATNFNHGLGLDGSLLRPVPIHRPAGHQLPAPLLPRDHRLLRGFKNGLVQTKCFRVAVLVSPRYIQAVVKLTR